MLGLYSEVWTHNPSRVDFALQNSSKPLQTLLGHDRLATTELHLNLSPEDAIREFLNKW